jgi:hypothetical protein
MSETCVDLTDAAVRRIVEIEPCKRPLVAPPVGTSPRWPTYPSKESSAAHPMFWRFPVQPVGPLDVPRHFRR